MTGKAEGFSGTEPGPLGVEAGNRAVYIGPAKPELRAGDLVEAGDRRYRVRRAQVVYQGDGPLYCWAMCTEKGGEDTWGSNG